jgi:DNA-binding beta-propeller fold protein YncE
MSDRTRHRRPLVSLLLILLGVAGVSVALGQGGSVEEGRIGPESRIQPSGRKLQPVGKLTRLGNLPAGGALTRNGRFLWTVSAGRGENDVRIVEVSPAIRCPRRGSRARRVACQRRVARRTGRVVQVIRMPGASGGIAMSPDGRTAYVSGTPEGTDPNERSPEDTPGKGGDVIHVFRYDARTGRAERDGLIELPPPSDAPIPQNFPPTNTQRISWPRDLAVSPDGKTLLAALNLADHAAVVDLESRRVRYVEVGHYPYGAAITRDGKRGLVSNETDGTVSAIDLERAEVVRTITVGPHLSHPEGIAADPKRDRAYVAVAHQDLIAVIDTDRLVVERTLSVERPEGIGTLPTALSVTRDGCRLLVANSGEDAVAIFSLTESDRRCQDPRDLRARRAEARAQRVLAHEGRRGVDQTENAAEEAAEIYGEEAEERAEVAKRRRPARRLPRRYELIGRIPVGSYPVWAEATPNRRRLAWIAAKGLGVGRNDAQGRTLPEDRGSATAGAPEAYRFKYLPSNVFGRSGLLAFPTNAETRRLTPRASRQIRPVNDQRPPPGSPIAPPGPSSKIEHVFYIVRENRTYDQILGDDPRGDGDPKLTLFGERITPNAHALAKRFPLLDHVYANSEASIDGHFWTSAANVSDYVVKNWHQNYAGRKRPYDFGVYAVTWPATGFLFDQAERQGISWFNFGEAIAGTVPLADRDRNAEETEQVARKFAKSDLGPPQGCFPNDASSGGIDEVLSAGPGPDVEVYDSSLPEGAPPGSESRFDCFRQKFEDMVERDEVPAFTYMTLSNDHTAGTTPGRRTPNAMIAENDYALGQVVDLISHSPIWKQSLILVIEDDSQDGADHVDAHRIPAFAISPYAKRGAVIHTRYDFLSFIRTIELAVGMRPLNLFDATAVPMYDVFASEPSNDEPYDAIPPNVSLTERNGPRAANARFSASLPLGFTDRTPQRYLDRILWQYVHGPDSEPPPPGPNASGLDEAAWRRGGAITPEQALEEALEGEEEEEGEEEGEEEDDEEG